MIDSTTIINNTEQIASTVASFVICGITATNNNNSGAGSNNYCGTNSSSDRGSPSSCTCGAINNRSDTCNNIFSSYSCCSYI